MNKIRFASEEYVNKQITDLGSNFATPDWHASEGEPGYIKNKTHGFEKGAALVEETEFALGQVDTDYGHYLQLPFFTLTLGKYYLVKFDDIEYLCQCYNLIIDGYNFGPTIGDYTEKYYKREKDSAKEPFSIGYYNDAASMVISSRYYSIPDPQQQIIQNTHTVSVYEAAVKQLDPKFIKDMYYSEALDEVGEYILPETELVYNEDGRGFILPTAATVSLKAGETYFVNYNGTQYKCVAGDYIIEGLSFTVLGNKVMGNMEDTGEPFVIICGGDTTTAFGTSFVLATLDDAASVMLSIAKAKEEIHYIDPKYIKNMYYGGDSEIILDNYALTNMDTALTDSCMAVINIPTELVVGKEYEVSIDGTLYTSTAYNCLGLTGAAALGNVALLSDDHADFDTGEPFAIASLPPEYASTIGGNLLVIWATGNQDLTLSISTVGEEIHKIDNKFIDAEWMATKTSEKGESLIPENTEFQKFQSLSGTDFAMWSSGFTVTPLLPTIGAKYIVIIDTHSYMLEAKEYGVDSYGHLIYAFALDGVSDITNFKPPVILFAADDVGGYPDYNCFLVMPNDDSKLSYTVSIYKEEMKPNMIPTEFLPMDDIYDAIIARLPRAEEALF